eukprot:150935_1
MWFEIEATHIHSIYITSSNDAIETHVAVHLCCRLIYVIHHPMFRPLDSNGSQHRFWFVIEINDPDVRNAMDLSENVASRSNTDAWIPNLTYLIEFLMRLDPKSLVFDCVV